MKMAGLTPPKPLQKYRWNELCAGNVDPTVTIELSRRGVTKFECKIARGDNISANVYLSKTPSKRVTPFLTDLDLCHFLKYKTPPHLTGESKQRGLRCNRLLSLDAFDRSVN
jgi:hypothetical protein